MMQALMYTAPEKLEIQNTPEPEVAQGEVVVNVDAVGICGSDMHAYLGHDPRRVPPMILGHEVAATIAQGPDVGKRVVLNPLITCGQCNACLGGRTNLCHSRELIGMNRPGGFAQQLLIPEINLIPIPDDVPASIAALTEPAATSVHAVHLAARVSSRPVAEAHCLVIGGGSVGLFAALLLRDQGCASLRLAETNPLRRETAAAAGIAAFDPVAAPVDDNSIDIVIDAVGGARTRQASIKAVSPGGVIMHIGLQDNDSAGIDVRKITLQEITVIGTYTYTMLDMRAALIKISSGALGDLSWIEKRKLSEGASAFADLLHGRSAAPKIILEP